MRRFEMQYTYTFSFFVLCPQDATATVRRAVGAFGRPAPEPAAVHVARRRQQHRLRVQHQPGRPVAGPAVAAAAAAPVAAAPADADHRPAPYRPHQPVTVHVAAAVGAPQAVHVIQSASPADHRRLVMCGRFERRARVLVKRPAATSVATTTHRFFAFVRFRASSSFSIAVIVVVSL